MTSMRLLSVRQLANSGKRFVLGALVALVVGACFAPQPQPGDERVPVALDAIEAGAFDSPLAADSHVIEPWRVVSIEDWRGVEDLTELGPVFVSISSTHLSVYTLPCQSGGWRLTLLDDNSYSLSGGDFTANECEEPHDILGWQSGFVFDALRNTNSYAFENGQLILSGDDVRIVLDPSSYKEQNETRERYEAEQHAASEYSMQHDVSVLEAKRRLELQEEMTALATELAESEPSYVTHWFEHDPYFGMVVAFLSTEGDEIIDTYTRDRELADQIQTRNWGKTLDELVAILQEVSQVALESGIPFAPDLNLDGQKVTLFTPYVDDLRAYLESVEGIADDLEYVEFEFRRVVPVHAAEKWISGAYPAPAK